MLLPLMGGAQTTWNTCILFFQAAVLAGACYSLLIRNAKFSRQLWAVGALFIAALLSLPVWISSSSANVPSPGVGSELKILIVEVALVCVALSTTSLILQQWVARHSSGKNALPVYAYSNLGSLVALMAYPLAIEFRFGLRRQSVAWSITLIVVTLLLAACALLTRNRSSSSSVALQDGEEQSNPPSTDHRLRWIMLSFIPASLLAGTNSFISTNVAPVPLFWIFPLAAYLLAFVIAFLMPPGRRRVIGGGGQLALVVTWLVLLFLQTPKPIWLGLLLPVLLLFFSALVCTTTLVLSAPGREKLAGFYVYLALGGLLGTGFNVLVAPTIFAFRAEYPLAILAACFFRSGGPSSGKASKSDLIILGVFFAGLVLAATVATLPAILGAGVGSIAIGIAIGATLYRFRANTPAFVISAAAVLIAVRLLPDENGKVWFRERTFFGDIEGRVSDDGKYKSLWHGGTDHGAELVGSRPEPLLYYVRQGPLGQVFASRDSARPPREIGVVGLGVGSASAYAHAGQKWTYYEINPSIAKLAINPAQFSFIGAWTPDATVEIGDGRLLLQRAADNRFDLLIVDAFNSDAIPVHLLTIEAFRTYVRKLAPGGIIAFHISNEYLALEPVLSAAARTLGLAARVQWWHPGAADMTSEFVADSKWVVLARSNSDLGTLSTDSRWRPLKATSAAPWTDDFSSVASVLNWTALTTK